MDEVLLCKECKHSFKYWSDFIFSDNLAMKCRKAYTPERIVIDPVVGEKKEAENYARCSYARIDRDLCGPKAIHWQPKNKSGLFKLIKKESV